MTVSYEWIPGGLVTSELLAQCATLYSAHYGCWSANSPTSPEQRIRLSPARLREWVAAKDTDVYIAKRDDELIGYAIAAKVKVPGYGIVAWVTQLVVHSDFRQQDVAKTLLFSIWGLSSHFAWGIVSANPYAIRALEKATRRRCLPIRISRNRRKLLTVGIGHVPYVTTDTEIVVKEGSSKINTGFFVDHSQLEAMIQSAISTETPWLIGAIEEGWEWFAFTFQNQDQINLSAREIEKMLMASDQVTCQAYARMQLTSAQNWMRHTDLEAQLIYEYCELRPGQRLIDFGCGVGRHAIALAKKGISVTGVDYVESNIERAKKNAFDVCGVSFVVADSRTVYLKSADVAICLYDVIGSYAENNENISLLRNIAAHVNVGGHALISVMNYELTRSNAKYVFQFSQDPNRLLNLPASQTMESTGNVFNPDYYLVDEETQVIYRREQFLASESLPVELVVRDRRFARQEIEDMCRSVGLDVIWSRYVSAGRWESPLDPHDPSAKEILLLCRKCPSPPSA